MKLIQKSFPAKRISPMDEHFFFGYYDLQPFSGRYHLAHKVGFTDRLNKKNDVAQIGLLNVDTEKFECLDETYAWCFQQGAMLQWNPAAPNDEIIFNSKVGQEFVGTVLNIHTGAKRYLEKPVANVSPTGKYALGINFSRLYDFRAGYGYPSLGDHFYYQNHSDKDGIHLIDMKTGKAKLIISLQQLWDMYGSWFGRDRKIVVNHITFNTDGTRFLFILRNFPDPGKAHDNLVVTANTDGSDMFVLSNWGAQSHYHWRDPEHVIFFTDGKELNCGRGWVNQYLLKDKTYEGEMIGDGIFFTDNHMSYSPDRKLLLNDTYPLAQFNKCQSLRVLNFEKDVNLELGRYYSMLSAHDFWCCDLHPRWNPDGKMISFDSTHEGFRGIYMVDMEPILEFFDKL